MEFTKMHKFVILFSYLLWGVGATTICLLILVLLGVKPNFLIGFLCAIPGTLIVVGTYRYLDKAGEAREAILHEIAQKAFNEAWERKKQEETECRFNKDGRCTYSEEPMVCVHDRGGETDV